MPRKKKTTQTPTPEQGTQPTNTFAHLPTMAAMFQSVQRDRVGLERALETRGHPDAEADAILQQFRKLEIDTVKYLTSRCEHSPIYPWLTEIKGIGERIAGMLIGLIDINKCDTPSALWRYAGFAVVCGAPVGAPVNTETTDGEEGQEVKRKGRKECRMLFGPDGKCPVHGSAPGVSEQRRVGVKLSFNIKLKKTCFLLARSFVLFKTEPYFAEYERSKAYYTERRPTWPLGRRDLAARRKMIKLFLSHLYNRWRAAENLPIAPPYAQEKLGHSGIVPPPVVSPPSS